MAEEIKEGWAWLANSPKWHYFRKGRSLCRRWLYLGKDEEQGKDDSSDNCPTCRKKLAKEKEVKNDEV